MQTLHNSTTSTTTNIDNHHEIYSKKKNQDIALWLLKISTIILSDEEKHNHNHRYKGYICLQMHLEALLWQNIILMSQIQNRSFITSVL